MMLPSLFDCALAIVTHPPSRFCRFAIVHTDFLLASFRTTQAVRTRARSRARAALPAIDIGRIGTSWNGSAAGPHANSTQRSIDSR